MEVAEPSLRLDSREPKTFSVVVPRICRNKEKDILLQRPFIENEENIIGHLLLNEQTIQESKEVVFEMWKKREKRRKNE